MPMPNTSEALDPGEFFHIGFEKAAKGVKKRIILADLPSRSNPFAVKFHLQTQSGQNLFTGHGPGYVAVNGTHYTKSLVLTPTSIVADWPVADFESLTAEHFSYLATF